MAASLLLHLTATSSAYIENSWIWVADHDLDIFTQDQIDVYSARGVLIESQGPTWLYGTTSEHNVLYQYQFSRAQNTILGMLATESPYFQPVPPAPAPFRTGIFPNDPVFEKCEPNALGCAQSSWAMRFVESSDIFVLGAGLYSWFSSYSQSCLQTENCQQRGMEIEQSQNIWLYNIATKAIVEMISPHNATPIYARDNKNGFLSSILAWLGGTNGTTGPRNFVGFKLYDRTPWFNRLTVSEWCKNALVETIQCDETIQTWTTPAYRGHISNVTLRDRVCDSGCAASISRYYGNVEKSCAGQEVGGKPMFDKVAYLWQAVNETCHVDDDGVNCNGG